MLPSNGSPTTSRQPRGVVHSISLFLAADPPTRTITVQSPRCPRHRPGLDNDVVSRDAFWDLIEQYGATYFCGHEHIFHLSQPRATQGGKAWQILVGSGGSPFEAAPTDTTVSPSTDRDYAWAKVKVFENGKVKITAYGFDDQYGKTRVIGSITLKN